MRRRMMASIGGGAKPWVNPYITDGLIAMWDGEWNAGGGVHDPAATVWKDLTGNYDSEENRKSDGWSWGDKYYDGSEKKGQGFMVPLSFTQMLRQCTPGHTVEIVFMTRSPKLRCTIFGQYDRWGTNFEQHVNGNFRIYYNGSPDFDIASAFPLATPVGVVCRSAYDMTSLFVNVAKSRSVNTKPKSEAIFEMHNFVLGGEFGRANMSIDGRLFCVRVYNRALTADEIAANYAIDKERFGLA